MPQTANISFNTKGTGHTSSTIYELTDPIYGSAVICTPNNGTNNRVTYSQLEAGIQVSGISTSPEYVLVTAINATCVGSTAQAWLSNAPAPTSTPAPTNTPSPEPTPTHTPTAPTATPAPTNTPSPTDTPVPGGTLTMYMNTSSGTNPPQGWSTATAACSGTGTPVTVYLSSQVSSLYDAYINGHVLYQQTYTGNNDVPYNGGDTFMQEVVNGVVTNTFALSSDGYMSAFQSCAVAPTATPTTPAPPAGASQYSLPSHTTYIPGSIVGTGNITFSGFSYASAIYDFVKVIANLSVTPTAGQWYNIAKSSITVYDNNSTYTELGVIGATYGTSQIKIENNGSGFTLTLSSVATTSNPISATGQLWYKM